MRKYRYIFIFIALLFSCKGNGQTPDPISTHAELNPDFVFSGDYGNLLTLEMASRITGFDASKAKKMNAMKGMVGETLRYYWENGREEVKEKSASNRKTVSCPRSDLVQLKWVDGEADMASFLDFIDLEANPELMEIDGVGQRAYWNVEKQYIEVYYNGVSFTLQVDISNDDNLDKEKTIELAKLIITEQF